MDHNKYNLDKFHESIQNKLSDDQWDIMIANKVICIKKDKNRRNIQFLIIPAIFTITAVILIVNSTQTRKSNLQAKNNHRYIRTSNHILADFSNTKLKARLINTVFNRFE